MTALSVALPFVLVLGFIVIGGLVVRSRVRSGSAPKRRHWFWPSATGPLLRASLRSASSSPVSNSLTVTWAAAA